MKAPETAFVGEEGDDLPMLTPWAWWPRSTSTRALAELQADEQRRTPVGEVGRVERRLEELVLDEQLLAGRQLRIDARERVEQTPTARAQVVLARVVRAVREPQAVAENGMLTDTDPLEAEVKRAMIAQAGHSTLLLDRSKLSARGLTGVCSASDDMRRKANKVAAG